MKPLSFLLLFLAGCSVQPVTQILVTVNADPYAAATIGAVRVELSTHDDEQGARQARVHTFPLREPLPISFGIRRGSEDLLWLSVKGCADAMCTLGGIEQKLLVRFQAERTVQVDVTLSVLCAVGQEDCRGAGQSCDPKSGECLAVQIVPGTVIRPGQEIIPDVVIPESLLDAGQDPAAVDASRPPNVCPADNACMAELYPCVPDDATGYVCQGQLADWPMPDSSEGAPVPLRYTATALVTHDEVTGLSWQRDLPNSYLGCTGKKASQGDRCTFAEARSYCAQLELEGMGWRVPTKIELESLLDLRPDHHGLDSMWFGPAPLDTHWTSSPLLYAKLAGNAYVVDPWEGRVAPQQESQPSLVRCVRSSATPPPGTARYKALSQQLAVFDVRTRLTWSNLPFCDQALSYQQASDWCANLTTDTWRLPSLKELLTLIDPTRYAPAIDPLFTGTPASAWMWSSTPGRDGRGHRLLDTGFGSTLPESEVDQLFQDPDIAAHSTHCVRCVK